MGINTLMISGFSVCPLCWVTPLANNFHAFISQGLVMLFWAENESLGRQSLIPWESFHDPYRQHRKLFKILMFVRKGHILRHLNNVYL